MEEKEGEQQNQVEDYCSPGTLAIDVVYDFFRVQFPTPTHNSRINETIVSRYQFIYGTTVDLQQN
ncbi:MAG: hypothetical protein WBN81_18065 [Gammaproteobacteria bacterium]